MVAFVNWCNKTFDSAHRFWQSKTGSVQKPQVLWLAIYSSAMKKVDLVLGGGGDNQEINKSPPSQHVRVTSSARLQSRASLVYCSRFFPRAPKKQKSCACDSSMPSAAGNTNRPPQMHSHKHRRSFQACVLLGRVQQPRLHLSPERLTWSLPSPPLCILTTSSRGDKTMSGPRPSSTSRKRHD